MYDGISVAYIGFAVSRLAAAYELTYAVWAVIVGIYMWKRSPTKTITPKHVSATIDLFWLCESGHRSLEPDIFCLSHFQ